MNLDWIFHNPKLKRLIVEDFVFQIQISIKQNLRWSLSSLKKWIEASKPFQLVEIDFILFKYYVI